MLLLPSHSELVAQVEDVVSDARKRLGVEVEMLAGKRETDLALLIAKGEKKDVVALPVHLQDYLPYADIELIASQVQGPHYKLTLVVTRKLREQPSQEMERRAKLRNFSKRVSSPSLR